jgi:NADH dehydrogenase
MTAHTGQIVTVFGGSGFLGRHVVRALCRRGWRVRVAMRRPHLGGDLRLCGDVGQVQLVQANVRNRPSIRRALVEADAFINLVGILYQRGAQTFQGAHTLGASNIAELAAEAGIKRGVYLSAIGASLDSHSAYAKTKRQAEVATLEAVPTATIIRPSFLFGPEDGLLTRLAELARLSPIMPVIGGGTRAQPLYVADAAAAIANALSIPEAAGKTYEIGGPRIYTMAEIVRYVLREIDRPRLLVPVPQLLAAPMGYTIGALSQLNPFFGPPLTGDQVQMLQSDNVVTPGSLNIQALGVTTLETVESIAPTYLWRHRPHGQFHAPRIDDSSRVDA